MYVFEQKKCDRSHRSANWHARIPGEMAAIFYKFDHFAKL